MAHPRHRKRREKLWHARNGMCHWCARKTVLPPKGVILRHQPPNLATIDHLDDRFSPERGKHCGEERSVLSCWQCNQDRARQSQTEALARQSEETP